MTLNHTQNGLWTSDATARGLICLVTGMLTMIVSSNTNLYRITRIQKHTRLQKHNDALFIK